MLGSPRTKPTRGCRRRRAMGSSRCAGESDSAMRPRGVESGMAVLAAGMAVLAAALTQPLTAQNADAPRAPRIIDLPSSAAPPQPAPVREQPLTLPEVRLPD